MPVTCKVKNCDNRAVLKRPKTGDPMCKECFFYSFETEIHFTILKGELFKRGDRVAIGASGGKDSTVLAYILKLLNERYDYGLDLFLLSIDEGITGYRDDSLETVKQNRDDYQLPLKILSYKDLYGWTMDEIVAQIGKTNNCTFCGVFRRQALDRGAALVGADIIATGHNADDVAETVIMNMLRGDLARLSRCTNIITEGEGSIPRCKPLKYAYEKEIVMYAHFKELVYFSTECIYAPNAYRGHTREYIKDIERIRPSCILDIIHSGETLRVNDTVKFPARRTCTRCGFVASQEICKACVLLEGLNRGIPKLGVGKSNKAKKLLGIHVPDGSENRSKKPPREGKSKKKIKRELQKEKQMKMLFARNNLSINEESTCAVDCSTESSNKITKEEANSLESSKKSSCGSACTSGCSSKTSEPSTPNEDETLTSGTDIEIDFEKILTFIENSLGIKEGSDSEEDNYTDNSEKSSFKGDCFSKNNEKSISEDQLSGSNKKLISEENQPSGSNTKLISEDDQPSGNNKKLISEDHPSKSKKKSTCGKSRTISCSSKMSTTSVLKNDELFLSAPEINDEISCSAFDSSVPLMSIQNDSSSSEDEEVHEEKVTSSCPSDLRPDSPPDSFIIDLDDPDDEGFDFPGFLSVISTRTKEEIQDSRIRQVFGFNSDDDLEEFFSCNVESEKEPQVESDATNKKEKLSSMEKEFEKLQLNANSQLNKTEDSEPSTSTVNESEKTESQSSLPTLKEPKKTESDEHPTVVKANAKKKGPSLILPHMMYKAKNNLDF